MLGEVEVTLEAVEEALCKTGNSLKKQSAREAVGTMGWTFLTVIRRAIGRRTYSCKKHEKRQHKNAGCEALWRR